MPPFVAEVPPVEGRVRPRGISYTAATRNESVVEQFNQPRGAAGIPDPPRQGMTPSRPSKVRVYQALAIAPFRAVQRDDFWLPIQDLPTYRARQPRGRLATWRERANISTPAPESFGSQLQVQPAPPDPTADHLRALMGVPG